MLNAAHAEQQTFVKGLSDAERAAIGTADHWSARDHVAHITFWKQCLSLILAAVERNETPPSFNDFESLNTQTFKEQRERSWADRVHASQQAHTEVLAHVQHFTEEDYANTHLLPPSEEDDGVYPDGRPLWDLILGNGYWHPHSHLSQFYLDRNDVATAICIQEACIDKAVQEGIPPAMHGIGLYNLACLYATTNQVEKAQPTLQQALLLTPGLTEWSKQDPDLAALRGA